MALVKTYSSNLYKSLTRLAVVKTNTQNLYKPPTRFVAIKSGSPNLYKLPTHFDVVKTSSLDFYNPPTHSAVIKANPYSRKWRFKFNEKSKVMVIAGRLKREKQKWWLGKQEVEETEEFKYLGVWIRSWMRFRSKWAERYWEQVEQWHQAQ